MTTQGHWLELIRNEVPVWPTGTSRAAAQHLDSWILEQEAPQPSYPILSQPLPPGRRQPLVGNAHLEEPLRPPLPQLVCCIEPAG